MLNLKITTQDLKTKNNTVWVPGEWKTTLNDRFAPLCTGYWLHYFPNCSPELVSIIWPAYFSLSSRVSEPRLWEVEVGGAICKEEADFKGGASKLRLVRELPLLVLSIKKKLEFYKNCADQAVENWLRSTQEEDGWYKRVYFSDCFKNLDTGYLTLSENSADIRLVMYLNAMRYYNIDYCGILEKTLAEPKG